MFMFNIVYDYNFYFGDLPKAYLVIEICFVSKILDVSTFV